MSSEILQPLEVVSTTPPPAPRQKSAFRKYWKLALIPIISTAIFILVNVYPPAKLLIFGLAAKIRSVGWHGPVLIMLFIGCVVIPLALPMSIFEMTIALLIQNYWYAVLLSLGSKVIGWCVVYYITKNHIRAKILNKLRRKKLYRGIERMIEKKPFRFSLIIRFTALPFFLKNYCLAVFECISFKIYILAAILGSTHDTMIEIYLFQRAENISQMFDKNGLTTKGLITIIMVVLSLSILIYIGLYTRRVIKEINEEASPLVKKQEPDDKEGHKNHESIPIS